MCIDVPFGRLKEKASSAETEATEWQRKTNAGESRCVTSQKKYHTR